jgi:FkbM family methyltransferase
MLKIINFILKQILKIFLSRKVLKVPLETHGSSSGKWTIPKHHITKSSNIILAGAGTDISFDVALYQKYTPNIVIMDPTPKAQEHFTTVIEFLQHSRPDVILAKQYHKILNIDYSKLHFLPIGLWNKTTKLDFFSPKNEDHVSFSALNLQRTTKSISLNVTSLAEVMRLFDWERIDLLKLDIEGSEYTVIESIFVENIFPTILTIEFDEMATNPFITKWPKSILKTVNRLQKEYNICNIDRFFNFTFVKK